MAVGGAEKRKYGKTPEQMKRGVQATAYFKAKRTRWKGIKAILAAKIASLARKNCDTGAILGRIAALGIFGCEGVLGEEPVTSMIESLATLLIPTDDHEEKTGAVSMSAEI